MAAWSVSLTLDLSEPFMLKFIPKLIENFCISSKTTIKRHMLVKGNLLFLFDNNSHRHYYYYETRKNTHSVRWKSINNPTNLKQHKNVRQLNTE